MCLFQRIGGTIGLLKIGAGEREGSDEMLPGSSGMGLFTAVLGMDRFRAVVHGKSRMGLPLLWYSSRDPNLRTNPPPPPILAKL